MLIITGKERFEHHTSSFLSPYCLSEKGDLEMSTALSFVHILNWNNCQSFPKDRNSKKQRRDKQTIKSFIATEALWETPSFIPVVYNCKLRNKTGPVY